MWNKSFRVPYCVISCGLPPLWYSCCYAAHMAHWQTWQMKHFVCFCLSTGSFLNTSLLSDQKGPAIFDVVCGEMGRGRGRGRRSVIRWYTAPVRCHTAQCLLGNNLTSCARHIQAMSREGGKERGGGEGDGRQRVTGQREKRGARGSGSRRVKGERGRDQFSSPISIMSSPVSIDLRIKLLRDLPELQADRCPDVAGPDVTDTRGTVAQNTTDPFVTSSLWMHTLKRPHSPVWNSSHIQAPPHSAETR